MFGRAERIRLRAHSDKAIAQPALQRTERLPFETVKRVSGSVTLCDRGTCQFAAPVIVVTLRTRKIELTLATFEDRTTRFDERRGLLIVCYGDWHAARLLPDKRGKRQH